MEKTLQQAYEEYCNLVYSLLLSNSPVDTGNMKTHIRMENNGTECHIIIDTVPYNDARIKKYGKPKQEIEYAGYTEYRNKSKGWVRRDSILHAAHIVAGDKVDCELEIE